MPKMGMEGWHQRCYIKLLLLFWLYGAVLSKRTCRGIPGLSMPGLPDEPPETNVGSFKNVWINRVGATFIEVGWKLDCSVRIESIEGYIVYYCPIRSPMHTECQAPQANSTFIGTNVLGGNITDLNPYTTYMLTVSVITKHTTFSQQSDPLFNTTLEAAPSPPLDLYVSDVSNSTVTISWKPPLAMNGVFRYYEVGVVGNTPVKSDKTEYMFTNLTSYKNYTLTVAACGVMCSGKTTVTTATKMGYANKIHAQ